MFIFLTMSLCSSPQKKLSLTVENSGQQYEVHKQAEITISLKANPTTGYSWQIVELDTNVVAELDSTKFKADSKMLGSPGIRTFHFVAKGSGTANIHLKYSRPWEKEEAPLETFQVKINVKE
jgi:inhibitor of cysteine peptidase